MTARLPQAAGRCQAATGMNMWTPLLLIALAASPAALQQQTKTVDQKIDILAEWLHLTEAEAVHVVAEFRASIEKLENATAQLLEELDIVRNRQAASAAVQASQVIMMVTYFLTILSVYIVKRCQKVNEESKRKEFERLEMQLARSKAKRRAAAAKEKSVPAQSLE